MALDLQGYKDKAREAVKYFWQSRDHAAAKKSASGKSDQGARGAVTSGKNMDGFIRLMIDIVHANGLPRARIHQTKKVLTLPGYFRPTKLWDLLIMNGSHLVAALEFKSQVGSFGNNFNNRSEEAIGNAVDIWTAYREGAFGEQLRPFVGWMMLLEDADGSQMPVKHEEPHFAVFPEFRGASYAQRYEILCRKMTHEQHYSAAAVLLAKQDDAATGDYSEVSELTGLRTFVSELAGHVAAEAARS